MFKSFKSVKFFKLFILTIAFSVVLPFIAFARTCEVTDIKKSGEPDIKLQVAIGEATCVSGISEYISTFYKFFVGAVATLAIFMIVIGGVKWLFARGNPGKITAAKNTIGSALMGMLLVFVSVALLRIINPDLISLKLPKLKSIQQVLFYDTVKCNDPLLKGKEINVGGQKVPGGIDNDSFKCGSSYNIEGTQQDCAGTACKNEKGEDGTCTPLDCLYGYGLWGSIGWEQNYFVDNMWLVVVCSNGFTKRIINKPGDVAERDTVYQFAINSNELKLSTQGSPHCGTSVLKGYLLEVEINDFGGIDDPSLLDATCQKFVVKADKPDEYAHSLDKIPLDTFLLSENDLRARKECNIFIKQTPERNLVLPVMSDSLAYKVQQWESATNELKKFLVDLNQKYRIIVTSISDDDIFSGKCEPLSSTESFRDDSNCVHRQNSLHYGGTNATMREKLQKTKTGFSCAADIAPVSGKWCELWDQIGGLPHSGKQFERAGSDNSVTCVESGITHLHVEVNGCQ